MGSTMYQLGSSCSASGGTRMPLLGVVVPWSGWRAPHTLRARDSAASPRPREPVPGATR